MAQCGMCLGPLASLAMSWTVEIAPGRRGERTYAEVPWRLEDWWVCWSCMHTPAAEALRKMIADEYMESVISRPVVICRAVCATGELRAKGRFRRFWGARQGRIGVPEKWAQCPVCFSACEV